GIEKGIEQGIQLGEQRGLEKGEREATLKIARSLLKMGMSIESVQEATGLSEDDLAQIRH
ncbi:ISNCY family transposase, partial [Yersinia enterocolitica]|nr:ISNCY family transposase [Yersinia enterocolitica]